MWDIITPGSLLFFLLSFPPSPFCLSIFLFNSVTCSPGLPQTHCILKMTLNSYILLPQPPCPGMTVRCAPCPANFTGCILILKELEPCWPWRDGLVLGKPIPRHEEEVSYCSDVEQLTLTALSGSSFWSLHHGTDSPLYLLLLRKTSSKALLYPKWPRCFPVWFCIAAYMLFLHECELCVVMLCTEAGIWSLIMY